MPIRNYGVRATGDIIRYFRDDRFPNGGIINFIQADYVRHIMVQPQEAIGYSVYYHSDEVIAEVTSKFNEVTGIDIPDEFHRQTSVYNVPGILMDEGITVPLRILRQQIFLGGSVYPIPDSLTEHLLFHALGNALWNYLDDTVWANHNIAKKNQYRAVRDLEHVPGERRHQHSLFYIAAEDFRYLFGTPVSGRGEWHLAGIRPPPIEPISNFWRKELEGDGPQATDQS